MPIDNRESEKNAMIEHNKHQTFKTDEIPCQEISDPAVLSKNPLVSVHMITYNHEKYIAQAIESALMQKTNFDYEIVIGEDCSTDKTRKIVDTYAKKYPDKIKLILNEKNIGMIPNFIKTLNMCRGKYIAMLEGDDYWTDPYKLQKQVDFLETNPDYGLVHSATDFLIEKKKKIIKWDKNNSIEVPQGYVFEKLLVNNFIRTLTVCVRLYLVLDYLNKYENELKNNWMMGDKPMWLEISRHTKIGYIPESLAVKRELEFSAMRSLDVEYRIKFFKSSYDVRFFFIEKYGCSAESTKKVLTNYYNRFLYYSFWLGDIQQAKKAYNNLIKTCKKIDKRNYIYYWGTKNYLIRFLVICLIRFIRTVVPKYNST